MFNHLKSRTVLTGLAIAALGLYYQAEDYGLLPMYLDAATITKLTTAAGLLTWYFRVNNGAKVGNDGRLRIEDVERIRADARAEMLKELSEGQLKP